MQPELDFKKIGGRIRAARQERGMSQSDLGAIVGCSNNHLSHVEVGQTKVSLTMLVKIAYTLDKDFDYFLMDTPYARCSTIINEEIASKLNQCNSNTLVSVSQMLDVFIDQQKRTYVD